MAKSTSDYEFVTGQGSARREQNIFEVQRMLQDGFTEREITSQLDDKFVPSKIREYLGIAKRKIREGVELPEKPGAKQLKASFEAGRKGEPYTGKTKWEEEAYENGKKNPKSAEK